MKADYDIFKFRCTALSY